MARVYRITCGAINYSIDEIAGLLARTFDIDFDISSQADCASGFFCGANFRIQKNYNEFTKTWAEIDESEFPIIVYIANASGKEKDKRSIHQLLKQQLKQRDYITFLNEEIVEQAD